MEMQVKELRIAQDNAINRSKAIYIYALHANIRKMRIIKTSVTLYYGRMLNTMVNMQI